MNSILGKCSKPVVTEINKHDDLAASQQAIADAAEAFSTIASGAPGPQASGTRPRLTLKRRVVVGNAAPAGAGAMALAPSDMEGGSVATPLKRLTGGRRELAIAHAGETYLLRVTKANKLILTKACASVPEAVT